MKLEDVIKIQIGKTPSRSIKEYWGEGMLWVSIADLKTKTILSTKEQITAQAIRDCGCKLIPKGTLLMSFKLSIGKLAFAGEDLFTNEAICGLKIIKENNLSKEYLYYALKNTNLLGSNVAVMGATLNTKSLNELKIPIPDSLTDQIKIAQILTQAEKLIAQRKESISLLDEFLKSTFLEMFGDYHNNKYKAEKLELYSIKITDGTHLGPKFIPEGVPFLLVSNIVNNEIVYETKKYISEQDYLELNRRTPIELGDILITSVGSYGNPAIVKTKTKFAFQRHIAYIKPNHLKINVNFLFAALKSDFVKIQIDNVVKGVAQKTLNLSELKKIKIPIPPLPLQNQFAQIVEKTEALKSQYQSSLQDLENLFGALSQKAFKGELDLGKIELGK